LHWVLIQPFLRIPNNLRPFEGKRRENYLHLYTTPTYMLCRLNAAIIRSMEWFNRRGISRTRHARRTTSVGPAQPIREEAWRGMASRPTTRGPRSKRQAGRGSEPSDRARGDGRRRRDTSRRGGGAPPAHMPLRSARAQTNPLRRRRRHRPVRPPPPAFR